MQDFFTKKLCRGCCDDGAMLLEGEELVCIPNGVEIVGRRVLNCLTPNGCSFSHDSKPVLCTMSPEVCGIVDTKTGRRSAFLPDKDGQLDYCPVARNVPDDFRLRVRQSVQLLIDAGVWDEENGPRLPVAAEAERLASRMGPDPVTLKGRLFKWLSLWF